MKNRIIALILVIAMSVLALVSCSGAFNCADVDFVKAGYASFDSDAFDKGIKSIKIEDGDFTTDPTIRAKKVADAIYKAVADAIASSAFEDEKKFDGELDDSDILYFVYYAVDEKTGNVFFTADMKESAITASSTKNNHFVQLGGVDTEDDDEDTEFMRLLKKNLTLGDIKDYIYEMDADAVSASDYKPANGDIVYISYSLSYTETTTDAEGVESSKVIDKSATYQKVEVKEGDPLSDKLIAGEKSFELDAEGGVKHKYSNVKYLWKVEKAGKVISSFKYTPYDTTKSVTPDNLRVTSETKPDLKDVELTYYVYPVYYYEAPSAEEISKNPATLLAEVYGSKLTADSFEALADEGYVFTKDGASEKVTDLVKKIADLYNAKETITEDGTTRTNDYYKEGTDLRKLSDAYDDAVKQGGEKPTDDQQDKIDDAKEALTKAQNAELDNILFKIVNAVKDSKTVCGVEIYNEYKENTEHSLAEAYNTDIKEKVQAEVWKLIETTVKINNYPPELLEEYVDHLYEQYEFEYMTGSQSTGKKLAYYDVYKNLEEYIRSSDCLNVPASKNADLDAVVAAEAKTFIDPIIRVFVVSQYVKATAEAKLPEFIQHDIDKGVYAVHKDEYVEAYGEEKGEAKYNEAVENSEKFLDFTKSVSGKFIIDDDYLKAYKKYTGKTYYKSLINENGECNVRAAFQFDRLFYYLTSTDVEPSEEGGHSHTEPAYTEDGYLAFRVVEYTLKEADTESDDK